MSNTATKNEPTDKKEAAKAATPIVEALEEDDEFEEFASAAAWDEVKDGVPATDEAAQWQVRDMDRRSRICGFISLY